MWARKLIIVIINHHILLAKNHSEVKFPALSPNDRLTWPLFESIMLLVSIICVLRYYYFHCFRRKFYLGPTLLKKAVHMYIPFVCLLSLGSENPCPIEPANTWLYVTPLYKNFNLPLTNIPFIFTGIYGGLPSFFGSNGKGGPKLSDFPLKYSIMWVIRCAFPGE